MDSSPSSSQRPSNKNACPICGQDKTAWSMKCGGCEANRQRYLASIERVNEDRAFLDEVKQRGQSTIARERKVSRQAISEQVKKAHRRLDFLTANPLPPLPTTFLQTSTKTAEAIPA